MENTKSKKSTYRGKKRAGKQRPNTKQACDKFEDSASERDQTFNAQKSRPNDPRWYAQNPQLLRDTASFPYSWPLGNRLNLGEYAPEINKGSVPGIMAISTAPTFGWADNANAPINVAARNIYSYVRHANSGHANYDAPDLMLYLCAMDSIYSYLSYLKRIYGVMSTYSYTNRYYPKAAVTAMGVDYDDIQVHLADFRAFINSYAVKVGSMCIPASMSYMAKHMWMYEGIYADSDQDKAQTYMFVPYGFYQYTLDADGAGALILTTPKPDISIESFGPVSNGLKFEHLRNYGNSLLDPVLRSEDMNIMSGDILKAFGPGNVYLVSGITETYTVLPSYNEEVLDQIQNCTLIGSPMFNATDDVNQSWAMRLVQDKTKGWLTSTPLFQHPYQFDNYEDENPGQNAFICNRIVTFEHGGITPEMTMEATRMTNIAREYDVDHTTSYEVRTLGSEVSCFATVYFYAEDPVHEGEWVLMANGPIFVGLTTMISTDTTAAFASITEGMDAGGVSAAKTAWKDVMQKLFVAARENCSDTALLSEQITQFNRHPAVSITTGLQDKYDGDERTMPAYGRLNGFLFDVNHYAILTENDLKVMSETALMSEFNITQYGRSAQ